MASTDSVDSYNRNKKIHRIDTSATQGTFEETVENSGEVSEPEEDAAETPTEMVNEDNDGEMEDDNDGDQVTEPPEGAEESEDPMANLSLSDIINSTIEIVTKKVKDRSDEGTSETGDAGDGESGEWESEKGRLSVISTTVPVSLCDSVNIENKGNLNNENCTSKDDDSFDDENKEEHLSVNNEVNDDNDNKNENEVLDNESRTSDTKNVSENESKSVESDFLSLGLLSSIKITRIGSSSDSKTDNDKSESEIVSEKQQSDKDNSDDELDATKSNPYKFTQISIKRIEKEAENSSNSEAENVDDSSHEIKKLSSIDITPSNLISNKNDSDINGENRTSLNEQLRENESTVEKVDNKDDKVYEDDRDEDDDEDDNALKIDDKDVSDDEMETNDDASNLCLPGITITKTYEEHPSHHKKQSNNLTDSDSESNKCNETKNNDNENQRIKKQENDRNADNENIENKKEANFIMRGSCIIQKLNVDENSTKTDNKDDENNHSKNESPKKSNPENEKSDNDESDDESFMRKLVNQIQSNSKSDESNNDEKSAKSHSGELTEDVDSIKFGEVTIKSIRRADLEPSEGPKNLTGKAVDSEIDKRPKSSDFGSLTIKPAFSDSNKDQAVDKVALSVKKEVIEDEPKKENSTLNKSDNVIRDNHTLESNNSLQEAVKLVQNIGNIAIKRLEHTSGNDKITVSISHEHTGGKTSKNDSENNNKDDSKSSERSNESPLTNIGSSISIRRATEKDQEREKAKMPSGVDTTRLSPSISIIPVSTGAEKTKPKNTMSPSPRTSTPQSSNTTPTTSTKTSNSTPPVTSSSSHNSNSNNIPPPPPLSHAQQNSTSTPRANMYSSNMPGMTVGTNRAVPSIGSPNMRMIAPAPSMMIGGRMPGAPRHLPPEAGYLSSELHKHSHKLAEIMRATLEEVLVNLVGSGTAEAKLAALQLELERSNWRHQQEIAEVRHNADVMLVEMRANLEAEKQRAVEEVRRNMDQQLGEVRRQMERQMTERIAEVRRQMETEKQRAIDETKKKQWCASCGKEALFFCCWNTSYCDYPCQVNNKFSQNIFF